MGLCSLLPAPVQLFYSIIILSCITCSCNRNLEEAAEKKISLFWAIFPLFWQLNFNLSFLMCNIYLLDITLLSSLVSNDNWLGFTGSHGVLHLSSLHFWIMIRMCFAFSLYDLEFHPDIICNLQSTEFFIPDTYSMSSKNIKVMHVYYHKMLNEMSILIADCNMQSLSVLEDIYVCAFILV